MDKDQFLLLLTRQLSGQASDTELAEIREALQTHPDWQILADQYEKYWPLSGNYQSAEIEKALGHTWTKIRQAPVVPLRAPKKRYWTWAAAAALVGVLALAGWWWKMATPTAENLLVSANRKGVRSTITLPDGSRVWLGGDSKLEYPAHFASDTRSLTLTGEAFFEVEKNPQKPFIVHTQAGDVRVLGTSFNILAYHDDDRQSTSVATGKVAFVPVAGSRDSVLLTPGKKVVISRSSGAYQVLDTDPAADRAWIDGTLVFDTEELGDISKTLERYYGIDIQFADAAISKYRFTGRFTHRTAGDIIRILSQTKAFPFTISDSLITIGK